MRPAYTTFSLLTAALFSIALAAPALAEGDDKDVGEANYNVADCSEGAGEKAAPENTGGEIESENLDAECESESP